MATYGAIEKKIKLTLSSYFLFVLFSCKNSIELPSDNIILRDGIDLVSPTAKKFFIQGLNYLDAKKYYAAKASFLKADSISPNTPIILNALGNLSAETFEDTITENYYKRALDIDSNFIQTYINYGAFLNNKNQYEDAKRLFTIALKKRSKFKIDKQLLYVDLAETYYLTNQKEIADYYLESAIEVFPNSSLNRRIINFQKQIKSELSKQKIPNN